MKKILVSGIKPSGDLHIGNFFGAIKQMIDLVNSNKYEAYIFVADYHSMTSLTSKKEREKNTLNLVATYLACGLNKNKVKIFKQSDIRAIPELYWILNTLAPLPMLFLAHAFKDKIGEMREKDLDFKKLKDINAGLFTYPVLMAADILLYGADVIPVGKDQEQHIEYARELSGKYNRAYNSKILKSPTAYINNKVATVLGIDGKKMSKSNNNTIPMFLDSDILKKRIMSIKTDNKLPNEKKDPDQNNIYNIHKLFLNEKDDIKLREKFLNSESIPYNYKDAKEELFYTIENYFKEAKKEFLYYTKNKKGRTEVLNILKIGAEEANKIAENKILKIKKEVGL